MYIISLTADMLSGAAALAAVRQRSVRAETARSDLRGA
jgi:hypothetical protein